MESLRAQLATVERLERVIADADSRLRLLNARLDEAAARTIELVVTSFAPAEEAITPDLRVASPGYFATLGLPLIAGREFADRVQGMAERTSPWNKGTRTFRVDLARLGRVGIARLRLGCTVGGTVSGLDGLAATVLDRV